MVSSVCEEKDCLIGVLSQLPFIGLMMFPDGSGIKSCYFYPNFLRPKLPDFKFPVLGCASLFVSTFNSPHRKTFCRTSKTIQQVPGFSQRLPPCGPDASNSRNPHQRPTSSTGTHEAALVPFTFVDWDRLAFKWHGKIWTHCGTSWWANHLHHYLMNNWAAFKTVSFSDIFRFREFKA